MKKHKRLRIFIWIIFMSLNAAYSANETPVISASSNEQSQQMLEQIQQLQAKQLQQQQQEIAAQQGLMPLPQAEPSTNNSQNTNSRNNSSPTFNSDFEYPFQHAQIRQTATENQVNESAFAGAVNQALPMNPQQIHRLKQIYDASQFAAAAPAGTPPEPTATSMYVNLSPGASPPAIRLSQGFVTSLVFLDSTGAPWPVDAYDLGNPDAFDIAWDKTDNVLMVQAKTLYTYGNLAIRLRGLNTPIMLTLIPGQQVIDYRVDVTVPGFGPEAKAMPINTGLPPQAAPVLLDVLDGIPPDGSKQLKMSDVLGEAWLLNGNMYVRTQYTLLSPGWLATMSSADGTNAYELQRTPMLLMSKNGKIVNVKIGGL